MHSPKEIRQLVQENIHQVKISEFVAEGGWPLIDDIEVQIFSQKEEAGKEIIHLQILYQVAKAGCCFIPGADEHMRLTKVVTIDKDEVMIA